jgi:cytoskeletal protein RodZ
MLDEGNDINPETTDLQPGGSGNRTFIIVGGILGALIFLTLLALIAYVLWLGPRLTAQRNAVQATIQAENAIIAQQMTSTAEVALWSPTLEPTLTPSPTPTVPSKTPTVASKTPTASSTPVVAAGTSTLTPTTDPVTLVAQQTELSQQMTSTALALGTIAIVDTGLPTTGFFDQVGLPSLIILTLVLVIVIFLARRLRKVPSR